MGLSGRKVKQRIGHDPRNLSWADDAARFGMNYLVKFGWDSSKGLGTSGDGMKSHLKVSQKLDMFGIGAAHQLDPNGIAWKQNNDFENLLKRLNGDAVEGTVLEGFKEADDCETDGAGDEKTGLKDKKKRRKQRLDGREAKKKRRVEEEDEGKDDAERQKARSGSSEQKRKVAVLPRHRARAIAAKSLSSKSAAHISEILGISPCFSTTATSSALTSGNLTPRDVDPPSNTFEIEKITTSTQSVHDYFSDKLKTKKFVDSLPQTLDDTDVPDSRETPRGGLGSSSRTISVFGSLISSAHVVESQAIEGSAVIPVAEKKRKKKSKEHQDNWSKRNSDPNNDKRGETIDGEDHHSEHREKKGAATDEESAPNLVVKKRKEGRIKPH